jgi:hypothetical protein
VIRHSRLRIPCIGFSIRFVFSAPVNPETNINSHDMISNHNIKILSGITENNILLEIFFINSFFLSYNFIYVEIVV